MEEFTDAEIERAFIEGLYDVFSRNKEPDVTSMIYWQNK